MSGKDNLTETESSIIIDQVEFSYHPLSILVGLTLYILFDAGALQTLRPWKRTEVRLLSKDQRGVEDFVVLIQVTPRKRIARTCVAIMGMTHGH